MILYDASECAAVQTISSCFIPPSLLPASIFSGIWHSDYTSVQSFCTPLSIFPLSLSCLEQGCLIFSSLWFPLTSSARCWYSPGLQPCPSISSLWHRWTQEGPTLTNACENFISSSPSLFIFVVPCVLWTSHPEVSCGHVFPIRFRKINASGRRQAWAEVYPIITLIWNYSPLSFHFTVRLSSTLCVTHNPLFGLTPFSSHHVW